MIDVGRRGNETSRDGLFRDKLIIADERSVSSDVSTIRSNILSGCIPDRKSIERIWFRRAIASRNSSLLALVIFHTATTALNAVAGPFLETCAVSFSNIPSLSAIASSSNSTPNVALSSVGRNVDV